MSASQKMLPIDGVLGAVLPCGVGIPLPKERIDPLRTLVK
jgi:hypothetical protein